ncbi:hypothetical protein H6F87_04955 [Cyanobacteria bacterium FACHB-502]|nr:hypothetical protein [Cyanobacteria bacterium FACHB-502]
MTAQKAQIESLIQEIDEVLSKTAPRLPWIMSADAVQQRQVLEQTRRYLLSLQEGGAQSIASQPPAGGIEAPVGENGFDFSRADSSKNASETGIETREAAPAIDSPPVKAASQQFVPPAPPQPAPASAQTEAVESAQQALQAVVQEMNYLRSNLLQPMRSDLDGLRQQREMLLQEIRQLEAQRQPYALPQQNQLLMEFLQAAFRQMQENLSSQVTQMISTLPQSSGAALPEGSSGLSSSDLMALSPAQRLEQIQRVQTQSDQLLLKLDSSLQIIFNSLQQNVQTYQDSLEQGLSRMHNLGQQGEAMFSALVTRLAEQLGREASTFLQTSIEPGNWEPALPPEGLSAAEPFPQAAPSSRPAEPEQTEGDITRLLDELNELDAAQPAQVNHPFVRDTSSSDTSPLNADDLDSLDLLDLELKQLDLDSLSPEPFAIVDEDLTLFQDEPLSSFLSTDLTVLQDDSEPEILQSLASTSVEENAFTEVDDDPSEVLDLLNQLDVEMQGTEATELQSNLAMPSSETLQPISEAASTAELPLVASPDNLYEDEFYQSLFGEANSQSVVSQFPEGGIATEDLFADVELFEPGEAAATVDPADTPAPDPAEMLPNLSIEEDWFSGFPEAVSYSGTVAESEDLTIVEAPELPQTVENVLLPTANLQPPIPQSPPQPPISIELDPPSSTPAEVPAEAVTIAPPAEEESAQPADDAIETISSLLDLVPFELSSDVSTDVSVEDLAKREAGPEEQAFELAQPEEDLLADEPSHPDALLNLKLPVDTLEQLAQDLSSLEGGDANFTLEDAADWMLPDVAPVPFIDFLEEPVISIESPERLAEQPTEQPTEQSTQQLSERSSEEVSAEFVDPAAADPARTIAQWFDPNPPEALQPTFPDPIAAEETASDEPYASQFSEEGIASPVIGQSEEPIEDLFSNYSAPLELAADLSGSAEDWFSDDSDSSALPSDLSALPPVDESTERHLFDDASDQPAFAETAAADQPTSRDALETNPSNSNSFTLEGLEGLFENLPSIGSARPVEPTQPIPDAFEELEVALSLQSSSADQVAPQEDSEKKKS